MPRRSISPRSPASPPHLRFYVLGKFRVERNGAAVQPGEWGRRAAAREILKVLLVQPDHRLHREQLLDFLWPDLGVAAALNKFAKGLHAARRTLEPDLAPRAESAYLHLAGDMLSLETAAVWIDLDEFERAASAALGTRDVVDLERARSLYGGELLPGDRYVEWTFTRREQLGDLHARVLMTLADEYGRRNGSGAAEAAWREVLVHDRAREEAHRGLMRLFAAAGARTEALRQYDALRTILREEFGVEPAPETEALHREIAEGRFMPAASIDPPGAGHTLNRPAASVSLPSVVRAQPPTPLVGRDDLYRTLTEDLSAAEGGTGQIVLLRGESGIGKSRLMADLARQAAAQGDIVLWGAGRPQSHKTLYGPFVEAVESYLSSLSDGENQVLTVRYPYLALLVPSLTHGDGPPLGSDVEIMHGRIAAEFVAFLEYLGGERPVLLALDDLQGADDASLHLLHALARSVGRWPLLIVAGYRDEELDQHAPLLQTIDAFRSDSLGRRVTLGRLSAEETAALAVAFLGDGSLEGQAAGRIYAYSLGNPLFVQVLIHTLQEQGALSRVGDAWVLSTITMPIPRRIVDLIMSRIDRLGPETRQVLALAAVEGEQFSVRGLELAAQHAYAASDPQISTPPALDRALQAGIVEDRGEIYAFPHSLFRDAILQSIPTHRRAVLHGAVAEAIAQHSPDRVEELAYHFSHSSDPDRALPYLEKAGDRARALHINLEAARYYGDVVARFDALQRPLDAARVRGKLAFCLYQSARYEEALGELERAAAAYADGDLANLGAVVAQVGHVHFLRGTADEGITRVRDMLDRHAGDLPPWARAQLWSTLASLYWLKGQYDDQLAAATAAVRDAREPSDYPLLPVTALQAEVWRGVALVAVDRIDEGIQSLEAVIPPLRAQAVLSGLSRAYNTLAAVYGERGDFVKEGEYIERAFEVAERLGDPARMAFMQFRRGWNQWVTGNWQAAQDNWGRAVELDREHGPSWVTPYVHYGLGHLAFARGDLANARAQIEQSLTHVERIGRPLLQWATGGMLARLDLEEGRPADAVDRLKSLLGSAGIGEEDRVALHIQLAEALLAQNAAHEARAILAGAEPALGPSSHGSVRLDLLRVAGMLALYEGNLQEAERQLGDLLRLARQVGNPFVEAQALALLAQVHLCQKDENSARQRLENAREIFTRLGAPRQVERIEAILAE